MPLNLLDGLGERTQAALLGFELAALPLLECALLLQPAFADEGQAVVVPRAFDKPMMRFAISARSRPRGTFRGRALVGRCKYCWASGDPAIYGSGVVVYCLFIKRALMQRDRALRKFHPIAICHLAQ